MSVELVGVNKNWEVARQREVDLDNLTVGKRYTKNDETGMNFYDDNGTLRLWEAFSWKGIPDTTYGITHVEPKHASSPLDNPKKAYGAAKAPFHASPELGYIQMSNVMAGGGWKYGDYNYHETEVDAMTYLVAMRRHYLLWKDGVDMDEESGQNHLAHIMACCAILIEAQATGKFIDNRPKTGLVAAALQESSKTFNEYMAKVTPKHDR